MSTQQAISPITQIEFHQRNSTVMNITMHGFNEKKDAVLIRAADVNLPSSGYCYVPYCQAHEIAWDLRDFGVCPICDPEQATRRQLK